MGYAAFQLPNFNDQEAASDPDRPLAVDQNTGNPQMNFVALHYLILSKCRTVAEVEEMMRSLDFVSVMDIENSHWLVSDETGDYAVFEYWGKGTEESPYELYVMRP